MIDRLRLQLIKASSHKTVPCPHFLLKAPTDFPQTVTTIGAAAAAAKAALFGDQVTKHKPAGDASHS